MGRLRLTVLLTLIILATSVHAQERRGEKLVLDHADQLEIRIVKEKYVTFVVGHVAFKTETGYIYCDSARWLRGENITLNGNVFMDDAEYQLKSDSVYYDIGIDEATAMGERVELWSYIDSLYAVGTHAFFAKRADYFYMENRPVMYVGYPDTANMIEVVADLIEYDAVTKTASAMDDVKISSTEFSAHSNCAVMSTQRNLLDLFDGPSVTRGQSTLSGGLISLMFDEETIVKIDVVDSAYGEFKEVVDSANSYVDESVLKGRRIYLDFDRGELSRITCYGQAYSWYYPSPRGGLETHENSVSGDTIRFNVQHEQLQAVNVVGGAVGRYVGTKTRTEDTVVTQQVDTVDYNSHVIVYDIIDSVITLNKAAHVASGGVELDAHDVSFDTKINTIEAYSAYLSSDTVGTQYSLSAELQPNSIPVVLRDKGDAIYGDYLLYSIDTEKGRIIQSKSAYDAGLYYGNKVYREQEHIFYVDDGRYTTCDAKEPHFHFRSKNMKLIQDDKLIARPVVFYIERLPILALPYYVFPLKKGRHSGILPFSWGKFERGERYMKNIGYYWAASEYWDWQGSFDYHEIQQTLTFNSRVNFTKRYVLNAYITGSYARETGYNNVIATETKGNRWTLLGNYDHTVTPSFSVRASGNFQSDKDYYTDYSQNLEERLNRITKSQVSFTKKFGDQTSLTGSLSHYVDWDREARTDNGPSLGLSLPTLFIFGSGDRDEQGNVVQKWYHSFNLRYSPRLDNYSARVTVDSIFTRPVDTLGDSTVQDTLSYRSRKEYTKISHNPSINLPQVKLGDYLTMIPRVSYSETWIKVHRTDQSDKLGIDASRIYRTYAWNAGVSANTNIYGTVYPNMFGLVGLRHVISPSVGYSYSPDINLFPVVRSYAGGASSTKASSVSFNLRQVFQAKVRSQEVEKNLELFSVNSGFSYNFEAETKPFSNLSTSIQSTALPILSSLSGSLLHSFYDPETGEEDFWAPHLLSFDIRAQLNLRGETFIFEDRATGTPLGADSASQLNPLTPVTVGSAGRRGWSLSVLYNYSESGRKTSWSKSSFAQINLGFSLTPSTSITYAQRYDIARGLTVSNSVNIVKTIHCWTGSLFWVPIGSNRGFGFKLFVTSLPDIKVDSNHDGFLNSLQR